MTQGIKIWEVSGVALGRAGANLYVRASGQVNTGGWTAPELKLRSENPIDGYLEFDFLATPPPPDRLVIQMFLPILAGYEVTNVSDGLKGVRVYSGTNDKAAEISTAHTKVKFLAYSEAAAGGGVGDPFPRATGAIVRGGGDNPFPKNVFGF